MDKNKDEMVWIELEINNDILRFVVHPTCGLLATTFFNNQGCKCQQICRIKYNLEEVTNEAVCMFCKQTRKEGASMDVEKIFNEMEKIIKQKSVPIAD